MNSALVLDAVPLVVLAALDAAFAGFRASCGRTGMVFHRAADRLAGRRGALLGLGLLAPVGALILADAFARGRFDPYLEAGRLLLLVYVPYGAVILLALAAYLTLDWRRRFLASAVLLGPMTLMRPWVALAGAAWVTVVLRDPVVSGLAFTSVAALLSVEPLAGRVWYTERSPGAPPP